MLWFLCPVVSLEPSKKPSLVGQNYIYIYICVQFLFLFSINRTVFSVNLYYNIYKLRFFVK